jgi:hypothetical protein
MDQNEFCEVQRSILTFSLNLTVDVEIFFKSDVLVLFSLCEKTHNSQTCIVAKASCMDHTKEWTSFLNARLQFQGAVTKGNDKFKVSHEYFFGWETLQLLVSSWTHFWNNSLVNSKETRYDKFKLFIGLVFVDKLIYETGNFGKLVVAVCEANSVFDLYGC